MKQFAVLSVTEVCREEQVGEGVWLQAVCCGASVAGVCTGMAQEDGA